MDRAGGKGCVPRLLFTGQIAGRRRGGIRSGSALAIAAHSWWGDQVDAADLARRFGLGKAARLSDGPVARGKQGLVWRLDTADGSWAVKMPFHRSSEAKVASAAVFQEAACAAGVPAPAGAAHHRRMRVRDAGRPAGQGV